MVWINFGTQTSPEAMNKIDTQSKNLASFGIVPCTASGTNSITLTPVLSGYTAPAYADLVAYSFKAAATTSGATTLKVGSLASLNCYRADGTTQISTNDIVSGQMYTAIYNGALNTSAGGFLITNVGQSVTPSSGSTFYLTTLTASNSASLSDTTHITSTYSTYQFVFTNIVPVTDGAQLKMQVTENASTFQTANYVSATMVSTMNAAGAATVYNDNTNGTSGYVLSGINGVTFGISNSAAYGFSGNVWLLNPNSAWRKIVSGDVSYHSGAAAAAVAWAHPGGYYDADSNVINGVKFLMSSGNISSGTIDIYGMKLS
ncbi:MAG: hypothetical protein KGL39_12495 [Patescibacteria group bacterium]|nr:hypothetical protein [Patescibacteria group bacterium]